MRIYDVKISRHGYPDHEEFWVAEIKASEDKRVSEEEFVGTERKWIIQRATLKDILAKLADLEEVYGK